MVLPLTDGLLPQAAGFVPPFLAYIYASKSNLLAYYCLQYGNPITFRHSDPAKAKYRLRIIYTTAAGLFALITSLNFVQRPTPIASFETLIALIFLPTSFLLSEMAIGEALGLYQQRLLKKETDGSLVVHFALRPETSHFWYRIATSNILTSLCIIGAFGYHETLSICVLYACSLYLFLSTKLPGKEADGMRTILLGSMFISLVFAVLYILMFLFIWFIPQAKSNGDSDDNSEPGHIGTFDLLAGRMMADSQWFVPASISALLIHIVSITLRFDYSNYTSRLSDNGSSVRYARLDKHEHGTGARPAGEDIRLMHFPKTYHYAALLGLVATALALHVALLFVPLDKSQVESKFGGLNLGGYSLEPEWVTQPSLNSMLISMLIPLAMLTVPATVFLTALYRGEVKALWAYKEDWTKGVSVDKEESSARLAEEEVEYEGFLPQASPSSSVSEGSLSPKQTDLISMQRMIFNQPNSEYALDTAGMLRTFTRGQVRRDAFTTNDLSADAYEMELIEDEFPLSVLVLAFDHVLLIVDESLGPIAEFQSAPILSNLPINRISSLKSSVSVEGACSLEISSLYNDDAPSEIVLFFQNQSALLELKETVTSLVQNAQIIEILGARLSNQTSFRPGYHGNKAREEQSGENDTKAKGKLGHSSQNHGDDLGNLRHFAKALVRRGNETKIFYVYLFSEALICIRTVSESGRASTSTWSDLMDGYALAVKRKLTHVPGWKTAASRLTIQDDMDGVVDALPPGDEPLVLKGRIYVRHIEDVACHEGHPSNPELEAYAELYPCGLKISMKRPEPRVVADLDLPLELFFTNEKESTEWLEELKFLINARKIQQAI